MKIVGIVVLVLLVIIVVGVLLVRWLLKRALKGVLGKLTEAMEEIAMSAPPPPRIHLQPAEDPQWDELAGAEEPVDPAGLFGKQKLHAQVASLGFRSIGAYTAAELLGVSLHAFCKPEESVCAVVYTHAKQGTWADFVIRYEDDTVLTVSNVPLHDAVAPPWSRLVKDTEASVPQLYRRLLSEAEDKPRKPVSAEDFPSTFEGSHAREMDWRNLRGGPTEDEIRRIAAEMGEEVTDEVVAATREQQAARAAEGVSVLLKERFLAASDLAGDQAERLFVVHDRLTRGAVCSSLSEALDEADVSALYSEDDPDADFDDLLEERFEAVSQDVSSTREVFRRVNDALPAVCRLDKVGELAEPVAADVYLTPEPPAAALGLPSMPE